MSVSNKNVFPPIIVEVEELYSECKKRNADRPESRRAGHISELAVVIVVIEVVSIVGKIGLHNIGPAIIVVVCGINPHACLFPAICAIRHTHLAAYFGEATLAIVVIEQAGRRIIGDIKSEAAI